MSLRGQIRKGSTEILILSLLVKEPMYGYQIGQELGKRSDGYFSMTAALLYPALHKLEDDGLVVSEWQDGQGKRKRKYYTITEAGQRALTDSAQEWRVFIAKLSIVLNDQLASSAEGVA